MDFVVDRIDLVVSSEDGDECAGTLRDEQQLRDVAQASQAVTRLPELAVFVTLSTGHRFQYLVFLHRLLLFHAESSDLVAVPALDLILRAVEELIREASPLPQPLMTILQQILHITFSMLSFWSTETANVPLGHIDSIDLVGRILCALMDLDPHFVVELGKFSLRAEHDCDTTTGNDINGSCKNRLHLVSLLAHHCTAMGRILHVEGEEVDVEGAPAPVATASAMERQTILFHIKAVNGLCVLIKRLTTCFDNQLQLHGRGVCVEITALLRLRQAISTALCDGTDAKQYAEEDFFVQQLCLAVRALAVNPKNKGAFCDHDFGSLILQSLESLSQRTQVRTDVALDSSGKADSQSQQNSECTEETSECNAVIALCDTLALLGAGVPSAPQRVHWGQQGACRLLTLLLKTHKHDVRTALSICDCIAVVAEYWRNRIDFSEAGAYETLFAVMTLHRMDSSLCTAALRALSGIAVNSDDQLYLKECGVCDLVIEILQRFRLDADLVREASGAIWSLSLNAENHVNFLDIGTCPLLWQLLQQYHKNVPVLLQLCGAIDSLTRQSHGQERPIHLASLQAHWQFAFEGDNKQVLVDLIMLNATFPEVLEKLVKILRQLIECETFRTILTQETFVFDVLSDCMEFHAGNQKLKSSLEDLRSKFVIY